MLLLVVAAIACYAMTLAPITWVILSEIFPNEIPMAMLIGYLAPEWLQIHLDEGQVPHRRTKLQIFIDSLAGIVSLNLLQALVGDCFLHIGVGQYDVSSGDCGARWVSDSPHDGTVGALRLRAGIPQKYYGCEKQKAYAKRQRPGPDHISSSLGKDC